MGNLRRMRGEMATSVYTTKSGTGLAAGECALLARLSGAYGRVTLLVPTYAEGEVCRRGLADAGLGISVDVLTPLAWLEGLWRLLGDGTRLVDRRDRLLLASRTLHALAGPGGDGIAPLRDNPGSVHMIADIAQSCLPFARHLRPGCARSFSPAEQRMFEVLDAYADTLSALALCEPASAAVSLADEFCRRAPACARAVVARGLGEYPEHLLRLIDAVALAGSAALVLNDRQRGIASALCERFACEAQELSCAEPPMAAPAFMEICGPTARLASYARMMVALRDACDPGEEVVVASPDPMALFRGLAPRMGALGISVSCEAFIPFPDTRAGEMLFALIDFLDRLDNRETSAWWPAPELADWLRSPLSGVGPSAPHVADSLDTWLRKTRAIDKGRLFAELDSRQSREQNRERDRAEKYGGRPRPVVFKSVIDALESERYGRAVQLMRDAAAASPTSAFGAGGQAAQRIELFALQRALDLLERACALGASGSLALVALRALSVPATVLAAPSAAEAPLAPSGPASAPGARPVRIVRTEALASSAAASYGAVLMADASADAHPLGVRETPATVFAEKLGCPTLRPAPAERQRDLFARSLQAARVGSALAFACRDNASNEVYPALAFAELREGHADAEAAVRMPALPGEGALVANLDPAAGAGLRVEDSPRPAEHWLAPEIRPYVLLSNRCVNGQVLPRALSASQVENYLACPYRWFVNSRVATRRLDVEFGAIERGNFSHDVMQRFYERLSECGLARVRPDTLDRCLEEMDRAFDEVRSDHLRGKYTHGRYASAERPRPIRGGLVPLDELERMRVDAMRRHFHEVVRHEVDLLPIYEPSLLEYSFDRQGVVYAGRPLGGRIDRVDAAPDAGSGRRFVVIDYKTGADVTAMACPDPTMRLEEGEELAADWLPGQDRDRAPKVQTLMYATALERSMGGSAQGAVYYGLRGPALAGAVSSSLTESEPPAFPRDKVSPFPGVKGRLRVRRDGSMEFPELLRRVESSISVELDRLESGEVAPRPASDSCSFCPLIMCEKRR